MTVKIPTGVVIPRLPDTAGENISVEVIDFNEYITYLEWITQRNTKQRAKKVSVRSNLEILRPPHLIVAIGELTADDEDENGNEYKAGTRFIIDSNTRRYFWEHGLTDVIPKSLIANVYKASTLVELRKYYYAYDNPDAVEQAGEVMTGIYGLFDFKPKSNKILGGSIVTGQNYASMWCPGAPLYGTNKGIWGIEPTENDTRTTAKRWAMAEQFKFWRGEWEYLDTFKIGSAGSVIDQPLLMALLIASKVYADKQVFDQLIFKLNCKDYNASEKKPISYIGEAATGARNDVYTKDAANYETYKKAYNYYLYWIQRHVENPDQTGCAGRRGGYDGYGQEWVAKYIPTWDDGIMEHIEEN